MLTSLMWFQVVVIITAIIGICCEIDTFTCIGFLSYAAYVLIDCMEKKGIIKPQKRK